MKISSLPGLTADQIERLQAAGIGTCEQLVRASRRDGRLCALQQDTGLCREALRAIEQRAELSQIRGVGPAALARLLDIGVTSMPQLAAHEPETVQLLMLAVTDCSPNLAVIESWILQARRESMHHADVLSP